MSSNWGNLEKPKFEGPSAYKCGTRIKPLDGLGLISGISKLKTGCVLLVVRYPGDSFTRQRTGFSAASGLLASRSAKPGTCGAGPLLGKRRKVCLMRLSQKKS